MEKITNFATAFIAAQKEMGNAIKDSTNPFFKNRYADLNSVREACIPALNQHGIAVLQPIVQLNGKNFVKTLLLHESGESMESLTEIVYSKQNDAQAQGSGITYARRYGLQSLVNIGAEDDDGTKATEKPKSNHSQLANISDELGTEMGELVKQKKQEKASEFLKKIKIELEAAGSSEEIELICDKNKKLLGSLKENYKDLFEIFEDCKSGMIEILGEK